MARPRLRPRRLQLELPGGGRDARRGRLVRAPRPRQASRPSRSPATSALDAVALPGQLDPPPAAGGDRGRRLLRRRLGRALPAADRRGHPPGVLLRARAGRELREVLGGRRRASRRSLATAPSAPRTAAVTRAMLAAQQLVGRMRARRAGGAVRRSAAAASRTGSSSTTSRSRRRLRVDVTSHAPADRQHEPAMRAASAARAPRLTRRRVADRDGARDSLRVEPVRPDADVDGERRVELPRAGHLARDDLAQFAGLLAAAPRRAARRGSGGSGASASRRARAWQRTIATLMMSAAVPWITVLTASRSPSACCWRLRARSSGIWRRRPSSVVT